MLAQANCFIRLPENRQSVFHLQKRVFDAGIDYIQVMDENGNVDQSVFPRS